MCGCSTRAFHTTTGDDGNRVDILCRKVAADLIPDDAQPVPQAHEVARTRRAPLRGRAPPLVITPREVSTLDAERTRKLILIGRLDVPETRKLAEHCRRPFGVGVTELHLGNSAGSDCRHAGLHGLVDLVTQSAAVEIKVCGSTREHFVALLRTALAHDLEHIDNAVRRLPPSGSGDREPS